MEPKKFIIEMPDLTGAVVKYPSEYIKHDKRAEESLTELLPDVLLGIDTETMTHTDNINGALDPHCSQIRLIQLSDGEKVFVYDMKSVSFEIFRKLLLTREFTGHNSIFDLRFFINQYASKRYIFPMNIHCTLIMAKLMNHAVYENDFAAGSAGLQNMVKKILDFDISKKLQNSAWGNVDLTFEQIEYAAYDPICALRVYEYLEPRIQKWGMTKMYKMVKALQHPLAMAELRGIEFNKVKHKRLIRVWAKKLYDARNTLAEIIGGNRITGTTIGNYLKENLSESDLALWPRTDTGRLKTDAHAMADFSHLDIVKPINEHSKYEKLCSTYGTKFQDFINIKTNRVHSWYNILGARTGRLSCSKPNMQQQVRDKEVRELFEAAEGRELIVADFSQIEVRVAAEISQDRNMLHAYREGLDIYKFTASKINNVPIDGVTKEQRQLAKACFSGDTEILTTTGFVKLEENCGKELEVYQYELPAGVEYNVGGRKGNTASRFSTSYQHPKFIGTGGKLTPVKTKVFYVPDRPLLLLEDQNVNICCTPDHQIISVDQYGYVNKQPAEDIRYIRSTITSGWTENNYTETEEFARVLAMFTADGSYASPKSIKFGFVKRRKSKRCCLLLKALGYTPIQRTYKRTDTSTGDMISIVVNGQKELVDRLLKYCDKKKTLTDAVLTDIPAHIFLEEAQYWDSHTTEAPKEERMLVSFSSTNERTLDIMQIMCATNGMMSNKYNIGKDKAHHNTCYTLSYWLKPQTTLVSCRKQFKKLKGLHKTYCVSVPSEAIVIRRNGKVSVQGNCVLGLLFGLGAPGFVHYVKRGNGVVIELDKAQKLINAFRETYSGFRTWQMNQAAMCEASGYAKTKMGKMRKLERDNTYGAGLNTPVQGTAAEIISLALIGTWKSIAKAKIDCYIILTVHDEIMLDCVKQDVPVAKKILEESMINAYLEIFPKGVTRDLADAASGCNWFEAK